MTDPVALDRWLGRGLASGELRPVDADFARFGQAQCQQASLEALLAAACLSRRVGDGHVCLNLAAPPADAGPCLRWLTQRWGVDPTAVDSPGLVGDGQELTPLVRQGPRLYLWRHWVREQAVAHALAQRLPAAAVPDAAALRPWLDALFGAVPDHLPSSRLPTDWQRIACALAARAPLAVLTGGPGTGKTTTVVRLLALLQGLSLQQGRAPLRIGLAAPTGKAAARLSQSIGGALDRLPWTDLPMAAAQREALRQHLPKRVVTLHRLIGRHADGTGARHDAERPLWLDLLVIDEASMVDLELLHDTLQALPPSTRVVLIGDRDQLASVEAGAVLAQLCARAAEGHYHPAVADWLHAATGHAVPPGLIDADGTALDQTVVMLRHSHRFGHDSGIGRWAAAVNTGDVNAAEPLLQQPPPDVAVIGPDAWQEVLLDGWRPMFECLQAGPEATTPEALALWVRGLLAQQARFQVLCALRGGPWGVAGLNERIVRVLQRAGLLPATLPGPDGWYAGRPVLVTRNAPSLGLMNGDLGLVLPLPPPEGTRGAAVRWRVAFPAPDTPAGVRWALPGQLTDVETAFAMTVHKSQGSEFDHVLLALPPDADSPVLSRELLYTGITRARQRLTLVLPGGPSVLRAAIARPTRRDGGLLEAMRTALP